METIDQVEQLKARSFTVPCVIFKHSTRCSISDIARFRLESSWNTDKLETVEAYYLDLIRFRDVSGYIAETFSVHHESPQILLIDKGECTYDASHLDISVAELLEVLPVTS